MDSIARIKTSVGNKWYDWKWQFSNRVSDLETLKSIIDISTEEEEIFIRSSAFFKFSSTPYYLSLIQKNNPDCPIRKQIIPSVYEFNFRGTETADPLEEELFSVVKGMVHRFNDRVLWYLSHQCGAYCRFCTRKRMVADSSSRPGLDEREAGFRYLEKNESIREVILSGGDPLTQSDGFIRDTIERIKSIPHINHLRIHTRIPVLMPMRITDDLCEIFNKHFPIYIVTHFNHPSEITQEATESIKNLITKGNSIVMNQNVLLSGINDNSLTLKELYYKLISIGVKPYYLHHCDEIFGISGFRVPYRKGLSILKELKEDMSGICVPEFVVDIAGAKGKMAIDSYIREF